jgi:hypothetical protein
MRLTGYRIIFVVALILGMAALFSSPLIHSKKHSFFNDEIIEIDVPQTYGGVRGFVKSDSIRLTVTVLDSENYTLFKSFEENFYPLVKVMWTEQFEYDIRPQHEGKLYFILENNNVDPAQEVNATLRIWGFSPGSPLFILGIILIVSSVTLLVLARKWKK